MKIEIKVPNMGESVNEAVVSAILKPTGSQVEMDEEVLELETDKVNQVLTSPKAGRVEWSVSVDETVVIGQVIGAVDTEGAPAAPPPEPAKPEEAPAAPKEPVKEEPPPKAPPPETKIPSAPGPDEVRVTQEAFVASLTAEPEAAGQPAAAEKPRETRRRMSKIRKTIARRLVEAQHEAAMLTTFNEVDMAPVMDLRSRYKEAFLKKHGVKLGFMSFFVKGCVAALEQLPDLNSYLDGEEIVHRETYDIGIAVGTERGLMVPVVRDCDLLSFAGIEQQIGEYALQARENRIRIDDLYGGGFTITNGGVYGSLLSTPILNPPQSGILGMHKIEPRPVVIDGEIVVRPMMYLALSYDHRIVDGKEAVTFLVLLKNFLEDPARLLLEI